MNQLYAGLGESLDRYAEAQDEQRERFKALALAQLDTWKRWIEEGRDITMDSYQDVVQGRHVFHLNVGIANHEIMKMQRGGQS